MSEREWQPGASDTGDARGERDASTADVERIARTTPDESGDRAASHEDARNVEGVQGAQGGREDGPERER